MAVYAIGDIQGCYDSLRRLLDKLGFDPECDKLWLVGDLVNRGPNSLQTLRFIRALGETAVSVLGNHDLALLAVAAGHVEPRRRDTFYDVLEAPDRDELMLWLRHRPVLHHDAELNFTLVHAGLAPAWDLAQARACAGELESVLRGPDCDEFLSQMFGNTPARWRDGLQGMERMRCMTNYFTRMRFVYPDGRLSLGENGPPGSQPEPLVPWFQAPDRRNADLNIVFGHWATLGLYRAPGIFALDSGCVWGNDLTALCLDDALWPNRSETVIRVACAG